MKYLKKLVDLFKAFVSRFKKVVATGVANPDTGSTVDPVKPAVVPSLDTKEGYEAWRAGFVPSTQSFIPTWEQKVEIDARNAANSGGTPVDRSGFTVGEGEVVNTMSNGTLYSFLLLKGGDVLVFPVGGNQLTKVNGADVIYTAKIPDQKPGVITISVESVDGRVGVKVV